MDHGLVAAHPTFDRVEVATSILIAIVASYAALALSSRVGTRRGMARLPWLIGGGSAVGLGIGGMHFVGMLAMRLNTPVTYDVSFTIASFAIAVIASTAALAAATSVRARLFPMLSASTSFGFAVAGMHYLGMAAMRGSFAMSHNLTRVVLSIAIAIAASAVAFWLGHRLRAVTGLRGFLYQLGSATIMGVAVAGMHYTAISAVTFSSRGLRPEDLGGGDIAGHDIALLVTIVGLIVLISAILVALIDQRSRQVARDAQIANDRYREMADAMPQIVWTARGDGSVDYFNQRWVDYTGMETVPSMSHWIDAFHPEDAAESAARWGAAVSTGTPYEIEYRLKRADGVYRWHLGRATPLFDGEGFVVKWFGTCTDIHEQKRAETYLRAHQATLQHRIEEREAEVERATELYQLLAENATDMVSTHRPDGMFEYATPSWVEFAGISPLGQYPLALCHPDDAALLMANYKRSFDTTEPITTVWRCRRADESYAWLETRTRAVRLPGTNRVLIFVCATRDITQSKYDEFALRQSEEKYRQLVEQAADAILLVDREGLCISANPRAGSLAAVPPSMLTGRVVSSFMIPVATPQRGPRRSSTDTSITAEYAIHRADGKIVPVEASVVKLADGGRQIIARDISGRKELERLKDEFISVVSHELRTPLASIRGALGLLASGKLSTSPEKSQRMLTVATGNAERLIRLINDILDVERIDSGVIAMEYDWCDGSEVAAQVIEALRPVADAAGVSLRLTAESIRIWADADRLTQTLTNLVGNAIKFSPSGSTIETLIAADRDTIRFAVRDEGRGIPTEKLETIFDRFQQVDASDSREKGGTGLGLAICRGIVEQHGGRIWAENNANGGSVFKFTFPRKAADIEPWADQKAAIEQVMRILVIEDDVGLAEVTAAALESRGLSVCLAHSGADALQRFGSLAADVLIVDLALPDVNGLDLLDELRRRGSSTMVPAIIYTAYDPDTIARDRIKNLGAELATKSRVPIETLVERVVELLRSTSPAVALKASA